MKKVFGPNEIVAYVGAVIGLVAFGMALAALSLSLIAYGAIHAE